MNKDILKVTTSELKIEASELQDIVDTLDEVKKTLDHAKKLKDVWNTSASKVFFEKCNQVETLRCELKKDLNSKKEDLINAGVMYVELEKENKQTVEKLCPARIFE